MLVLCRRINQRIVIGELITITVVSIHGGAVRIAIDAPKYISVHRQEVYDAIKLDRDGGELGFQNRRQVVRVNGHSAEPRPPLDMATGFPSEVQSAILVLAQYLEHYPGTSTANY
jgi:carbon storage regulator